MIGIFRHNRFGHTAYVINKSKNTIVKRRQPECFVTVVFVVFFFFGGGGGGEGKETQQKKSEIYGKCT